MTSIRTDCVLRFICLMLLARGDFESFPGMKKKIVMLYFEGKFSFEDKEKLSCVGMEVTEFAGVWRHELFDYA